MEMCMRSNEMIRLGNIYGFTGGSYAGNVYAPNGLCPSINTCGGGNREPMVIEVRDADRVLICSMRGRDKDNPKFRGKSNGNFAQALEVREDQKVTNTITTAQKDNLLLEIQEEPEVVKIRQIECKGE